MSLARPDRFAPSEALLRLPMFAAEHLVIAGLTAPQWRLALVLVCMARDKGNVIRLEKPSLEKLAGVTLNTTHKLLSPLLEARIDLPAHELHGEFVFENIEYDPGKRGRSVGQVRATLTIGMGHFLSEGGGSVLTLPADEMRRYSSVSSIILRLRFGAAMAVDKGSARSLMRITSGDVSTIFGCYGDAATIKRASSVTGEIAEHVSLSRAGAVLIDPAVNEINAISRAMRLKAAVMTQGRAWTSIDVEASRLTVRTSAPKPAPVRVIKVRRPGTRKVVQSVKL